MKPYLIATCLFLGSAVSFGQTDPLGSTKPTTYTIADLPTELVAAEVTTSKDNLSALMMMSMGGGAITAPGEQKRGLDRDMLFQLSNIVWAPANEFTGQSPFMIGYKTDFPTMPRGSMVDPSTIRFRLTYFSRSSIISLTPRADFAPSVLRDLVKEPVAPVGSTVDRTITLSNLKQIALGTIMLSFDYDDYFPYVQSTPQLFNFIEPYTKNREILKTKNPMGGDFRFNMSLAGASMTSIEQPAGTPMFYESEAWPDGKRCVAYTDGHVKVVAAEDWQKLQPLLKLKLLRKGKPIPPGGTIPPMGPNPKVK